MELQDKRGLDSTRPDARQFDHTRDQRTAISLVPSLGYLLPYKLNLSVLLISCDMLNLPDGQD